MVEALRKSDFDSQHGSDFAPLNRAYQRVFKSGQLTLGLVVPIENYGNAAVPGLEAHLQRVQLAEALGFASVWLRDVPFNVPSFGDAGQIFDPFVYLGALALNTSSIALGVASVVLPARHPAHVAKAAHSADVLSEGRVLLGIASGDRPEEFPALGLSYSDRAERFRAAYNYLRDVAAPYPKFSGYYGHSDGQVDLLPKPYGERLPLLITGSSQQAPDWIAANGDGWMTYPRSAIQQQSLLARYREDVVQAGLAPKPTMEPFYLDLHPDADAAPTPIHLGFRLGINRLRDYLSLRQQIGVNHIALNLRFNQGDVEETLNTIAEAVLPHFSTQE